MPSKPKKSSKSGTASHRSTLSIQKTEIIINIYDLLPPGKLSSFLWTIGGSLLHSGVVIKDKEYAYGGHDRPGMSGVYWTRPKTEPPGGTFRCEILHGFTIRPEEEIEEIIKEASHKFQGTSYNLLTNNCNHFTSYLCQQLTSRPAPRWLNRAASIGVALPCVVPREWISPPDGDTADGELLESDEEAEENNRLLRHDRERRQGRGANDEVIWEDEDESGIGKGKAVLRDSAGRTLPAGERAPT